MGSASAAAVTSYLVAWEVAVPAAAAVPLPVRAAASPRPTAPGARSAASISRCFCLLGAVRGCLSEPSSAQAPGEIHGALWKSRRQEMQTCRQLRRISPPCARKLRCTRGKSQHAEWTCRRARPAGRGTVAAPAVRPHSGPNWPRKSAALNSLDRAARSRAEKLQETATNQFSGRARERFRLAPMSSGAIVFTFGRQGNA